MIYAFGVLTFFNIIKKRRKTSKFNNKIILKLEKSREHMTKNILEFELDELWIANTLLRYTF